jgi:hypothetical protein
MLCHGVLLINAESLKQHLASKRHANQLKRVNVDLDPICFAKDLEDKSDSGLQRSNLTYPLKVRLKPGVGKACS